MLTILEMETYSAWFEGLRDKLAEARIAARIDRLALGNPGMSRLSVRASASCAFITGPDTACIIARRGA